MAILFIDKPGGITSFDVIRRLRKELGIRKMGHAGTLDPMATGLLIIATEKDTKQLDQFLKLPKSYRAEVLLGIATNTGDMDGEVINKVSVEELDQEKLTETVRGMMGEHELAVPLYSAIKVDGKPLYKYARAGQTPPRIPVKPMIITDITLLDHHQQGDQYALVIEFAVTSGSYIRTLAEELGRRLGYPATLQALRRLTIGEYSVENARQLASTD